MNVALRSSGSLDTTLMQNNDNSARNNQNN